MTRNPFLNALAATGYITLISSLMFYAPRAIPKEDTVFAPIAMLSLFTLSAAVMGFLFFYQPFVLYFENKKKQALNLFFLTVASFAGLTVLVLILLFSGFPAVKK
jgi:hypothetical protein